MGALRLTTKAFLFLQEMNLPHHHRDERHDRRPQELDP
jgi:hypothetical protein